MMAMKCELCGGLVTWRGPFSALTHTECESCGERNCQIVEGVDERLPEMIVGHSEMQGGWCVYEQVAHADYDVRRGPFATETEANAALATMANGMTPNVGDEARRSRRFDGGVRQQRRKAEGTGMEVRIFTPPAADQSEALGFGLTALTQAIGQSDSDAVSHGALGGEFGYGARFENDTFLMRPYCWCEQADCLWCTIWLSNDCDCTEDEAKAHRAKQDAEIAERFGADSYRGYSRAPNFWHKATGLKVNWYKWIGRDMEIHNPNGADLAAVMSECMATLRPNVGDEARP